ncbi:hypothetical protein TNCV_1443961 [Trichonephila clavipes]|nr:hypothetical protein TNCV_1443961 [Trichonephila clavipes]
MAEFAGIASNTKRDSSEKTTWRLSACQTHELIADAVIDEIDSVKYLPRSSRPSVSIATVELKSETLTPGVGVPLRHSPNYREEEG